MRSSKVNEQLLAIEAMQEQLRKIANAIKAECDHRDDNWRKRTTFESGPSGNIDSGYSCPACGGTWKHDPCAAGDRISYLASIGEI
jgi:hypothetical protein